MTEENIKIKKTMNLSASVIGKLKSMEQSIAREVSKKLEDSVPEGHPLKAEIEKQKSIMGGDLSGLPEGHPLVKALKVAKETYEVRQIEENKDKSGEKKPEDDSGLRKAKRLDEDKVRRARMNQEERDGDEIRVATKNVNSQIDEILSNVHKAWQVLGGYEEVFNRNPNSRAKFLRLKRILFATERGLSETRIGRV